MRLKTRLLSFGVMAAVAGATPVYAAAQTPADQVRAVVTLDIPAGPASAGLNALATQADVQLFYPFSAVTGRSISAVKGEFTRDEAIRQMAQAAGLTVASDDGRTVRLEAPQSGSAAGAGAEVEALIVTAQKREEDIQDVPIAMSAFTQEQLTTHQIAGGPDLMTQIPNVTFTKTNFSGYSIQIRGIGTQAISATVDPAVAVAFNNTPILRNRFFEQEFYDLNRIEVLRGPQGTLYGRNATAGVINLLSARPKHYLEAKLSADIANYNSTRLEGMINLPLVEDKVAVRMAGAWTKRDGFVTNTLSGEQVDGRDLWSTRLTLGFEPAEAISAYLTYEHFEEDDDRLRSGKQLCKKDTANEGYSGGTFGPASYIGQGCVAASLYSDESFQTPNGFNLPYWGALQALGAPVDADIDPYLNSTQSRDLRQIETTIPSHYRAKTDIVHLQLNFDLTEKVSLTSETAFTTDSVFSTQDYNRFAPTPQSFDVRPALVEKGIFDENGLFCDPQLGCSDRLLLGDLATSESQQYGQEFRLSSDFDGPTNFSLGVNFLRHDAVDKYYVFVNVLTAFAADYGSAGPSDPYRVGLTDNLSCMATDRGIPIGGDPTKIYTVGPCVYIDPNPIGRLNDLGHNYFLSKNPYRLISYAAFGELYYNLTPDLKLTAGLRYTVDKKHAPNVPSWLLASKSVGYPVAEIIDQEWREPTGRIVLDWQPQVGFTDETLLYASYSHGYKAGGANPPRPVFVNSGGEGSFGTTPGAVQSFLTHPKTFEPEFVDAFEIGTKNTLLDGRMTLNGSIFYYDYEGYQISEIVNRAAVNRNFDTEVWGAELEVDWRPIENLKISFKGGWEKTRVADGEKVIDLMDRTAGDPNYAVIKAFPTIPSNCIVPVTWLEAELAGTGPVLEGLQDACISYFDTPYPGLANTPNNGEGIEKDLSGNELPNAPEFTTTLTVDYTIPLPNEWLLNLHADLYRQSEAWTRIINSDPYDRLKPYETVNLAAIFANEDAGWTVMAYVKNVFDKDSVTGAFLNSDDSGLTTNVFLTEPRLYGLRVTKAFSGGSMAYPDLSAWLGGMLELELGASAQRVDAPNERIWPDWVNTYPEGFEFPFDAQDHDMDKGDGREGRLTYTPHGSLWNVSAGVRYGRTNSFNRAEHAQQQPGGWYIGQDFFVNYPQYAGTYVEDLDRYISGPFDHAAASVYKTEEHMLVDFAVGREAGLGVLNAGGSSQVQVGLRYGEFKSVTAVELNGIADAHIPPTYVIKYSETALTRTERVTAASARRTFEGFGPQISWDASARLLGDDHTGYLDAEWGVGGGVLFGRRKTSITGQETERYIASHYNSFGSGVVSTTTTPFGVEPRSEQVTVPNVAVNLGLGYEIGRLRVGAGYRWERYFDVLDVGHEEGADGGRTIDGPYFKIAVGFGG